MCFSTDNLNCVNQKTKRRTKLCTYLQALTEVINEIVEEDRNIR